MEISGCIVRGQDNFRLASLLCLPIIINDTYFIFIRLESI